MTARAASPVDCPRCAVYRETIASMKEQADNEEKLFQRCAVLEDLLTEAMNWLQDPSSFWGTPDGKDFLARVDAATPSESPSNTGETK